MTNNQTYHTPPEQPMHRRAVVKGMLRMRLGTGDEGQETVTSSSPQPQVLQSLVRPLNLHQKVDSPLNWE